MLVMDNSVKIALIIVSAIVLLAFVGIGIYFNAKLGNTVNVNGLATVKAVPNLISVYFNVETSGNTTKEANDKNSEIVDNILTELIKIGIDRKNITTENFNVYEDYQWNGRTQTLNGYKATHSIRVLLATSDTGKIGDVIDAGVNEGAKINYINFELSQDEQNKYKAQALEQATKDAKIKAESIASGLGKKVGKIVSVSDNTFDYYPWPIYAASGASSSETAAMAKSATTNIQPGERDISAQVNVVFKIV
jgi:hypothetical protein